MDQRLAAFMAVVEQKGFSRAGLVLHMTQPAVSQHVQALERELGTRLLERSNRLLHLTPAGVIVYDHARQILEIEERMRRYVSDLTNEASGSLSIGASHTIGEFMLPIVLAALQRRYPLVTPTVTIANTQHVAELVGTRRLDLGLVEGELELPQVQTFPLFEDRLTMVAPPGHCLAGCRAVAPASIAGATWLVREMGSGTRAASDAYMADHKLTSVMRLEFGSTQMIKEAIAAGMGISLLSRWATRREVSQGVLVELPVEDTPRVRRFSALMLRSRFRTGALEVFKRLLDEMTPELTAMYAK
jgi:DNA-binding transcriptional LysR family regulator